MAKVSAVEKNKHRRKLVDRYAEKRAGLKAIVMDRSLPIEERFRATLKLSELPRNSAKVRIRNRCEVSGRPRGYYRKLKMSRIALRELGSLGKVPGVVKSSW
ncbi:MAG: 30S ribosomal protein S14 [Roseitalea sp.]|jgi:small subunit ribosomal protein S14|uniref:Small ribosomal subunit protein uS14 n=1 Tax=Oceaniradius stylonematis TaxID=2184161 RepID=A0A3A8ACI3_9HYPH|nr:30S ribosomal protein S14 [Oceaniradius stylonematis]MBO6552210.1 30S ribosomal protein S14 [Roseitalea sp.]MBO6950870.1 30S ribosomal protein S14 [Rhizobiaceae bacterium]RNC95229.1 MAG: 30S ribosomal protein S14 [Oricola sp.]MBO6591143.1 30S ribosomal protein S14 [Roseitalea sp.]MBO6598998.1 30S ribosomal protein S14 [Roseitalea sp.]